MIQVLGITHQFDVVTNIQVDDYDHTRYKWSWIDFNKPTDQEMGHLDHLLNFHPLAIEDCTGRLQRPKLDYYEDYTFFVTHTLDLNMARKEINFFIGDGYIVTFHYEDSTEVNHVWNQIILRKTIECWDEYVVFYQILDKIVDHYFPILYSIEEKLDKIENNKKDSMEVLLEELFNVRHSLLNLRHTINPMRDLLYRMLNSHHLEGVTKRKEYFGDIYDHLLKLSDMLSSNREITADIRDSYISINAHQTNKVMQILTIITSIFAPLTFIAGIYGMNFEHMPEIHWKYGYLFSLGLMVLVCITMYYWFRRKGWFIK